MLVIVAALKSEIIPLFNHYKITEKSKIGSGTLYMAKGIHFLRVGIGEQNAVSNLKLYLQNFSPSEIINIGFAGKMHSSETRTDVFWIRYVVHGSDGPGIKLKPFAQNNLPSAALLTVNQPLKDTRLRDTLFKKYHSDLVDMEAWYLADFASKKNIPFYSIKVVSDQADQFTEEVFMVNYQNLGVQLTESVLPLIQRRIKEI